jgi:antitoxin component YwqK of YwqJK toxin-antitoxin module
LGGNAPVYGFGSSQLLSGKHNANRFVFYAVAVVAGYQFALRQPTEMEHAQRYSPLFDPVPPHQSKRLPILVAAFLLIALIISKNLEPYRGVVKYYYEDGSLLSEGNMIEGKQDGYWAFYDQKGHLIQTGMHQDGYAHGNWTWYFSDNKAVNMVQPYAYGNAMGLNLTYRNNGTLIDSVNFHNGRKNGEYVSYNDKGGIVSRGHYQHDRREGEWLFFYDSGELKMRINYLDGDLHGRCLFYHPNGVLAEELQYDKGQLAYIHTQNAGDGTSIIHNGSGYYRVLTDDPAINGSGYVENGQPIGEWELYSPQIGQLNKGRFEGKKFLLWQSSLPNLKLQVKDGKGYYKEFDQYGKTVLLAGKINNGLREGRWISSYESGTPKADEWYVKGQLNGKASYYYSNDNIEFTAHFKAGKWHGKAQFFNENGTLDSEAQFKNDLKTGIQYFYDEKGQRIREELYENGRLIKTKLNFREPDINLTP